VDWLLLFPFPHGDLLCPALHHSALGLT
jgi:hypothetical protein